MDNLIGEYKYTIIILLILSNALTIIFYLLKKIHNQANFYELSSKKKGLEKYSLNFELAFLKLLRREIGSNRILSKEELIKAEEELEVYEQSLKNNSKEELLKIIHEMNSKYSDIEDYDFWGMKFYVSIDEYKDKVEDSIGKDLFKGKYLDLCKRIIVMRKYYPIILGIYPETELEEMKYHFRYEPDKKKEAMNKELKEILIEGMHRYDSFRKDFKTIKDLKKSYEDDEYIVGENFSAERNIEYGVTIKRPYQYGIVSSEESWTNENGEYQSGGYSFYMTDENYENRVYIGNEGVFD